MVQLPDGMPIGIARLPVNKVGRSDRQVGVQ